MYEGDDPLQPRYEYVGWLEQSFPSLGPKSNLIPVLEDTLTRFKDDERYKQDPRYVELLIKYVSSVYYDKRVYIIITFKNHGKFESKTNGVNYLKLHD